MKKIINKLLKIDYKHFICISVLLSSLLVLLFCFPYSFARFFESLKDIGTSFVYYFGCLVFQDENFVIPTVNNMSVQPFIVPFNLPTSWADFVVFCEQFFTLFGVGANFSLYLDCLGNIIYNFSYFLLLFLPIILCLIIWFNSSLKKKNNFYNKETKPLKIFKKFVFGVYVPIKNWIKELYVFFVSKKIYLISFLVLWAFSFNLFSIVISFIAFYLYFVASFKFETLYIQFIKLLCDLSPVFDFIPLFVWIILGFLIFNKIRRSIAYKRLNHWEMKNRGFINSLPIVVMGCGTMGSKKTTMITDMGLSQEVMFRDKAFEKILENDLKFPNFPWINLENVLKVAIARHDIYSLATCKKYIDELHNLFISVKSIELKKAYKRLYKRKFGVNLGSNLLFDYDFEKYGFYYDDKLKVVDIWAVIKDYSQLYFFYTIQSSLLIANYSIRTDNLIQDLGNFPVWDTDFFKRDSRLIDSFSRHSHILDFDMLRLGKKVLKDNPLSDVFEFGIVLVTEIGKERGNTLELSEKKKSSDETNQKNDLFDSELKMVRHSGSIENFSFVRFFCDEQRPESWGANSRDLCNILHMNQSSDICLAMPFFELGELIYSFLYNKFSALYSEFRFYRGDTTLFMYLFKGLFARFQHYYLSLYNQFGYMDMSLLIENGTQDGETREYIYKLMIKKIYSKRFSTDCHSGFFYKKSLRSAFGLSDLPEYESEKSTAEELNKQHSYFIDDLNSGLEEFEKLKK